ncbi:hypothetical protein ACHAXA_006482 [Cyclostephanos tholiformis]|uniref:Uncharacterized protein n=1 Tax=Cyclostephanos tholiformis TaxID=382380 RepID=A0ABD3RZF7_9STRA
MTTVHPMDPRSGGGVVEGRADEDDVHDDHDHDDDVHDDDDDDDDDDDSSGSYDRGIDDDDVPTSSRPPPHSPSTNDMDRIRQRAIELLRTDPIDDERRDVRVGSSSSSSSFAATGEDLATVRGGGRGAGGGEERRARHYRSYHDDPSPPCDVRTTCPTTSTFPSWVRGGRGDYDGCHEYDDYDYYDRGLTLQGIAGMALSCVATCIIEGYRAASDYYYGGYYEGVRVEGGGSGGGGNDYDARHPPTPSDEERHTSGYDRVYADVYQRGNVRDGEVMERGIISTTTTTTPLVDNEGTGRSSGGGVMLERTKLDEWERVRVPSTYQGGSRAGW